MDNQMIAELYQSANLELRGYNIPRHEFIDLRQELVCQTLVQYRRLKERGKEPDLLLLKHFLRMRKKELWTRSFVGKNGGGTSQRDIMNQKHQWDGTFEKVDFIDDLPNTKMNTRKRAEDNISFFVDFSLFLDKLSEIQRQIIKLLMEGFKLNEIARKVKQSYLLVMQITNSVKEAYAEYFEIELQLAK